MPRPFNQDYMSLYDKLPFSDTGRPNVRAWAEAKRREFTGPTASGLDLSTEADDVYDQIFILTSSGTDLDEWGAVLDNERLLAEGDVAYRVRLLAQWQLDNNALTVQAVTDCVATIGATYLPVITVLRVHEYYKAHDNGGPDYGRRADAPVGGSVAGDGCLGEIHGLSHLDYLTFGVELNRSPSVAEAIELIAGAGGNPGLAEIKPAHTRGHIITDAGLPNPPRYRMHAYAYSQGCGPLSWDDNFNRAVGVVSPLDRYDNSVGTGGGWTYIAGVPDELFGDASANAALCDVLEPRQDIPDDMVVVDLKNVYVRALCRFVSWSVAAGHFSGFCFRVQPTNALYAICFRFAGGAWKWAIQRFTGAAWVVEKAFVNTGIDMSLDQEVEIWIRGNTLITLRVGGVVLTDEFDVGPDIIVAGGTGIYTRGTDVDVYVADYHYW